MMIKQNITENIKLESDAPRNFRLASSLKRCLKPRLKQSYITSPRLLIRSVRLSSLQTTENDAVEINHLSK